MSNVDTSRSLVIEPAGDSVQTSEGTAATSRKRELGRAGARGSHAASPVTALSRPFAVKFAECRSGDQFDAREPILVTLNINAIDRSGNGRIDLFQRQLGHPSLKRQLRIAATMQRSLPVE
jgi:hypothetical protein